MPGEFASYKAGQPFEALVHRDPVSHKLLEAEYVRRIASPSARPEREAEAPWGSARASADLSEADWD